MKKLIYLLASTGILFGCATMPKENIEDKFYDLMFQPFPDGLMNEYDTDGDGTGDLAFIYEFVGESANRSCFELRAIKTDKNKDGTYSPNEVIIIPPRNKFVKL
jgi:hypothetical protein